ncbi:MAG: ABC transporter permease [Pseudomonadales bacterium]|nr:ABC transporter permease [Pseudomonadales bacterium]
MFLELAVKSIWHRRLSLSLTVLAMALSVMTILGVEHIRHQAKESFASTVSDVDLIVGARTGPLNLLLYSVFHIGAATHDISPASYSWLANQAQVDWAVPIALGDSHRGFRVVGTSRDYFDVIAYGQAKKLEFQQGQAFEQIFDLVLGADVAAQLGYGLEDQLIVSHGLSSNSFSRHDKFPFTVVGILAKTGTPVDQSLLVSLPGLDAIHQSERVENRALIAAEPIKTNITAVMLGLQSRLAIFATQRSINRYAEEPLTAILPGVSLLELWQIMAVLENVLLLISSFVLIASLLGLSALMLMSLRERRQEIYLLRMIGASPLYLFSLILFETMLVVITSIILGLLSLFALLFFADAWLLSEFGLAIGQGILYAHSLWLIAAIILIGLLFSLLPALSGLWHAKRWQQR